MGRVSMSLRYALSSGAHSSSTVHLAALLKSKSSSLSVSVEGSNAWHWLSRSPIISAPTSERVKARASGITVKGWFTGKRSVSVEVIQKWLLTGVNGSPMCSGRISRLAHAPAAFTTTAAPTSVPSCSLTPVILLPSAAMQATLQLGFSVTPSCDAARA